MLPPRKPWLAALLTIGLPGLGDLYAGRLSLAGMWAVIAIAVMLLTPFLATHLSLGVLAALLVWLLPLSLLALAAVSAWRSARAAPVPYVPHRLNRWFWYLTLWLAFTGLTQAVLRPWTQTYSAAFRVPSVSMAPTLQAGDFLYVQKIVPAPPDLVPGSLIVFASTEEPGLQVLKRIVGGATDTLAMRAGILMRNGVIVEEPFVQHDAPHKSESPVYRDKMKAWQLPFLARADTSGYAPDISDWGPIVVPRDSLFVLGDNREVSYDSRYYGFVPVANVLGTPRLIYFSYDPNTLKAFPPLSAIRWTRIGRRFPPPPRRGPAG